MSRLRKLTAKGARHGRRVVVVAQQHSPMRWLSCDKLGRHIRNYQQGLANSRFRIHCQQQVGHNHAFVAADIEKQLQEALFALAHYSIVLHFDLRHHLTGSLHIGGTNVKRLRRFQRHFRLQRRDVVARITVAGLEIGCLLVDILGGGGAPTLNAGCCA
eukprot:TRINITY_DN7670_c0_g1_i3.p2 TRINITY_DN7670_c0_g1~~TRINITY_DN7670_c0_g1_i3.p2  ORF type:complete len:159 (+),score=27.47 TRINITY_DN7670_c0_g1_i3:265-741(+)